MLNCPFSKEGTMAGRDIIMLSQKELKRIHIIQKVADGVIKQVDAAGILLLSTRQIRRIVKNVKAEGEKGIIHKSRGRDSNRKTPKKIRDRVVKLYRAQYRDFGPTLATEKLFERDGIKLNDETLRTWLIESGDWKKTRKRRVYHQWRERKQYRGEMIQMDGSHHDWLEGRGPWCVLMGYIDDATGTTFGRFYEYEGTIPAMDSFKRYIKRHGIPMSVYLDKHTTYKSNGKPTLEDELNDTKPLSEFERALKELGVEVIHANSPQAKGRVERLFGTLQDRLVKEMRLKNIRTIQEANIFLDQYLPAYNRQFAVIPVSKENLHRDIPGGLNLNDIFCVKTKRTLRNDFTIAHNRKLYQIQSHIHASAVLIHDRMDGSMTVTHNGRAVQFAEIAARPVKEKKPLKVHRKIYHPTKHDSWKNFKFGIHKYEQGNLIGSKP
jgi:transposase-like protein